MPYGAHGRSVPVADARGSALEAGCAIVTASVRPRLLFLTERYPTDLGGVASSSARISTALSSLGLDVDVVAWTRSLPPGVVAQAEGITRVGRFREWDNTMPH